MNNIEKEIFDKIKEGDTKAFDIVFTSYYPILCIYAKDLLKTSEIAEEVVQDVFVKLWNNRSEIFIKSSLKAYLYRMVHNHSLNYLRDHSTRKTIKALSMDDLKWRFELLELESSYSIFDQLLSDQMENDLNIAIEALPEQCKKVFCFSRYQGFSYSKIAEQLDISVSSVKTQMQRAVKKLKEVLDKYAVLKSSG